MAARHDDDLFAGGGETGALMRGIDWASTPLGPVEQWPRSLRTCVRVIAHLAPADVRLVGRCADQSLQRRLPQHPRRQAPAGDGPARRRSLAGDLGRRRAARAPPRSRATKAPTTKRCCSSWSATAIPKRRTTPSPTARSPTTKAAPTASSAPTPTTRSASWANARWRLLRELAARTGDARTVDDACALSTQAIESDTRDLPFAMLYEADADDEHARLCSAAGIAEGHHAAPVMCDLDGAIWPLADALRTHAPQVVDCASLPCTLADRRMGRAAEAGDRADRAAYRQREPQRLARRRPESRIACSTPVTNRSCTWSQARSARTFPTRRPTKTNAAAHTRSPNSIARRPRSSATSATNSARRSRCCSRRSKKRCAARRR